jgi:phytanoyl-CoA hydroxylase
MQYQAIKAAFGRDGFVIVRQLLPPAEFNQLTGELQRYIRDVVPGLPDTHAFYVDKQRAETLKQMQYMGVDSFFRDYPRHDAWQSLAAALVGEAAQGQEPEWFNKPPGTDSPTPPHQDNYYFCLTPPKVATIWMALDAVDDENGCLHYVRGSHLCPVRAHGPSSVLGFSQGILDFGEQDRAQEQAIHLRPGDVVVHHGNTIHRAEANRSASRQRRAFAMVFRGVSCRRDEQAFARYQEALQQQHAALGIKRQLA